MAGKNILIFSDGTGQAGGLLPDERRSNIYKLFRATRCGPDSSIDPADQLTFYDPGLGTQTLGSGTLIRMGRWAYNKVSQAMGLGLTANIIDCYAAILTLWEPGDRIYLFGFSRGAYTVRCLGGVLGLCGVPTTMKDGTPLRRDPQTTRAIAAEAVRHVYQHVSSPKDERYLGQRNALAARFRAQHDSDADGKANAVPYFIGVFDTVAALGSPGLLLVLALGAVLLMAVASGLLALLAQTFWFWFGSLVAVATVLAGIAFLKTYVKYAVGLKGYTAWETLHLTGLKMRFYDNQLNPDVAYAKHALAIDENRAGFRPRALDERGHGQRGRALRAGLVCGQPLGCGRQLSRERGPALRHCAQMDGRGRAGGALRHQDRRRGPSALPVPGGTSARRMQDRSVRPPVEEGAAAGARGRRPAPVCQGALRAAPGAALRRDEALPAPEPARPPGGAALL
jgi:hypothetical protein